MDDNKILTLASNERIALTPEMRLIFEISNLRTATPATVSRAGILYINPGDLGWNPFVTSWVETRENTVEKANLTILFDKYIPILQDIMSKRFKKITPIPGISHIQVLCRWNPWLYLLIFLQMLLKNFMNLFLFLHWFGPMVQLCIMMEQQITEQNFQNGSWMSLNLSSFHLA